MRTVADRETAPGKTKTATGTGTKRRGISVEAAAQKSEQDR